MASQTGEGEHLEQSQLATFRQMTAMELLQAYQTTPNGRRLVPDATRQAIHSLNIAAQIFEEYHGEIFSCIDTHINCSSIGFFAPSMSQMKAEDGTSPLFPAIGHCTKWNTLHFEDGQLTTPIVQEIIAAFPAVTELAFLSDSTDQGEMERLTELLSSEAGWGLQLTSLKLVIGINTRYRGAENLFKAINALSSLRYLKIDLGERGLELHELTVLDQLEMFSLCCFSVHMPHFISQLYATRNDRLRIELNNREESIKSLAAMRPYLRDRIVRLSSTHLLSSRCNFSDVLSKFPSLTSLALELPLADAADLFTKLANLRQLFHLNLSIKFWNAEKQDLCPLPSVKGLELLFTCESHDQLEWLNLPQTMPHLQAIGINYFICQSCNATNCEFGTRNRTPEKLATTRQCISAMLQILSRTGVPMGAISFRGEEYLGSAEQLLQSQV